MEYCAFELHSGIPMEGQEVPWRPERIAAARSQFEQAADAEGLLHARRTHWYNSVPAHEASLWADDLNRGDEFRHAVFRAYFADVVNIADSGVLARIADGLGLDSADLRPALAEGRYRERVSEQFEYARASGITAVPSYVAGNYVLVGAHPYATFQKLIETAESEQVPQ